MIGAIVMGIGLAVAQPTATDDAFLNRFAGRWRGAVHYSQWTVDLFDEELRRLFGGSEELLADLRLPYIELQLSIDLEDSNIRFSASVPRDSLELGNPSFLPLSMLSIMPGRRTILLEDAPRYRFLAPPDPSNTFLYYQRHRAISWEDARSYSPPVKGSSMTSDRREYVLEQIGVDYLSLHVYSFQPRKQQLITVYFWRDEID